MIDDEKKPTEEEQEESSCYSEEMKEKAMKSMETTVKLKKEQMDSFKKMTESLGKVDNNGK